ncbi:MAG: hypothetical protein QXP31_03170 [Pyrobaculum sp.]
MTSVASLLGPHAYTLARYGISPYDDLDTAIDKLKASAPHLAKLLEDIRRRHSI